VHGVVLASDAVRARGGYVLVVASADVDIST